MLSRWMHNGVRSIATVVGAYGSIVALSLIAIGIAALLVVSMIPLYLSENTDEAFGEGYCINNYTIRVGLQIPEYNTTFNDSMTTRSYSFTSNTAIFPANMSVCSNSSFCRAAISETVLVADTCMFQLKSIISPAVPNAKVLNSYALGEACYRTLQSCSYDSLLTSCLLSNCVAVSVFNSSGNASSPLTYYTLSCAATIYYKTRCMDAGGSDRLFYSASQRNSACRQQRMNRINTCLNSTVSLSNVPCMVSVSSGLVTSTSGSCTQTVSANSVPLSIADNATNIATPAIFTWSNSPLVDTSNANFLYRAFSVSDGNDGHVYRIASVNSVTYNTSQVGARYCGVVTRDQIASAVNVAISSQSSG